MLVGVVLSVPPLEIRTSIKTHYLVTVGLRLGYAWGRLLPYVTAGMAIGDLDFSQSIHDLVDPSTRHVGGKTQTNVVGWSAAVYSTLSAGTGAQESNINILTLATRTSMLASRIVRIFVPITMPV